MNPVARDIDDQVALLQPCFHGRAFLCKASHHDAIVAFCRIQPQPWACWHAAVAGCDEAVEHRLEKIDRHNHVALVGLVV